MYYVSKKRYKKCFLGGVIYFIGLPSVDVFLFLMVLSKTAFC